MKSFKNSFGKVATALISIFFINTSCDLFDLDINQDPSNPLTVTPELLLPSVMLNASATLAGGLNQNVHGFVGGSIASADSYDLTQSSYVGTWATLYTRELKDLDEAIKFTEKAGTFPKFLGVSQVLKAYYFSVMVDLWGDVPYFNAFNANNADSPEKNPTYDSGELIYKDLLLLLDKAIVNLNTVSAENLASGDPIYKGDVSKWIKAANSIKLKLLIQTRLVFDNKAAIADVLTKPLITSTVDDFQFQFGKLLSPDNRHPWYQNAYTSASNGFTYIGHQIMFEMLLKGDPRFRFYFKRQTNVTLNQNDPTQRNTTPCSQAPCYYGYIALGVNGSGNALGQLQAAGVISNPVNAADLAFLAGIFGRDRGDRSGVPQDGNLRTAPGVYPAGGFYDDTDPTLRRVANNGAFGNGIFPMVTASMVRFYQVEAILALGTPGNAKTLLEEGLRIHIAKVVSFGQSLDANAVAPTTAAVENYVNNQLAEYDGATGNDNKLDKAMKVAWFSNFGNGYEIYNTFRRTGFPSDIRVNIQPPVRGFALRLPYSQDDLTLNTNAASLAGVAFDAAPVFWDK